MTVENIQRDVEACRRSHARLNDAIAGLTDAQARQPSLLPGWSVGHLLTHIARNADSAVRRLEGAARGQIVDQYPGGAAGREADIEAGASRPARALIDDVAQSSAAVDEICATFPSDAWENGTRPLSGEVQPAHRVVFSRWREVEVHHVDLGLGYQPSEWPTELVQTWLPGILEALPDRADPKQLLAWALRRGPAPELAPW